MEEAGFVEEEPCVFRCAFGGGPWRLVLEPDPDGDVFIRHVLRDIAEQFPDWDLSVGVRNWIARNFEPEDEEEA